MEEQSQKTEKDIFCVDKLLKIHPVFISNKIEEMKNEIKTLEDRIELLENLIKEIKDKVNN